QARNLIRLQSEFRFCLDVDLIRPPEPVEVVGVERAEVHLQGVEDVGHVDAVGLRAFAIDVRIDLRHADLEARKEARQRRNLSPLPERSLQLRVHPLESQAAAILDVQLETTGLPEALHRRRRKDRNERLLYSG